jgi:hypothetical protein
LEKSTNVLNSSDEKVTLIFFMVLFIACSLWAAALWLSELVGMSLYGIAAAALISVPIPHNRKILGLLLPIFDRIPSHDDLAKMWMTEQQVVHILS